MSSNNYEAAFRAAFGPISTFLVKECGYQIAHGNSGDRMVSLRCPYHEGNQKNNSGHYCHADDTKGVWHCFKCANEGGHLSDGGSYVQALMEAKNMDAKEAFRYLCDKAGLQQSNYEYSTQEIRSLYTNACYDLLKANSGNPNSPYAVAIAYLTGRGFTMESIDRHRVGYCDGFKAISSLRKKGITEDQLFKAGILRHSKKSGKAYPAFGGRVTMMTGENLYGRAVSPENTLRHFYTQSSNSVFNEAVLDKDRDILFIVESAFDAITIEQYIRVLGVNWSVIATCGTKGIKMEDLKALLNRATPAEIILIPDSDPWYQDNGRHHAAGQTAGLAKARALEAAGFRVRIMVLPDNSDPNDLSKKKVTAAAFEDMVRKSLSPAKFAIYCTAHYYTLGEHNSNIGFLNMVRKSLGRYKVCLTAEILDYLILLTQEDGTEIKKLLAPAVKRSDALDFIRSEISRGKNIEDVMADLQTNL